jgi:hypothetical protein
MQQKVRIRPVNGLPGYVNILCMCARIRILAIWNLILASFEMGPGLEISMPASVFDSKSFLDSKYIIWKEDWKIIDTFDSR